MKERIKQLHDALGLSGREFSTSVGQSPGWSRTINKTIGVDVLSNILRRYPQINSQWLIYGEGNMFVGVETVSQETEKTNEVINIDYRLICDEFLY